MARRVLVVDDDADALALISLTLRRRGYEIMTAASGPEALDILARDLPDLVLLDVMMPFMDGYEVCSRLRADPCTASLPVVMLTAKAQSASRIEGFRMGADDYVTKPVHPDELVSRISAVLDRVAEARARQSPKGAFIGCVGCKGGTGVTTVAVNIGLALTERGQVMLADFSGDATFYLGQSLFDWRVMLSKLDPAKIDRAAIERSWVTHSSGLCLLHDANLLANQAHVEVTFAYVSDMVDFCVFDLGSWAFATQPSERWIIENCKAIALTVAPGRVEVERARKILKQLDDWQVTASVHLVWVNHRANAEQAEVAALGDELGHEVASVVPYAPEETAWAVEQASPLVVSRPDSPVAKTLQALAEALVRSEET